MPQVEPTLEEVRAILSYDAETGEFTWLIDAARNIKAGSKAGASKGARLNQKTGKMTRYKYIRINNMDYVASRIAWLLHYGEWPKGNVMFKDQDPSNVKIANLEQAKFTYVKNVADRKSQKMSHETQRHFSLKQRYGMSIETYNVMLAAQNGVCGICQGIETYVPKGHGTPKPLSVDHNHATGEIRGLLCSNCNYLIGHCKEDREILLAAVKYLDKHAGLERAAPKLTLVPPVEEIEK